MELHSALSNSTIVFSYFFNIFQHIQVAHFKCAQGPTVQYSVHQ